MFRIVISLFFILIAGIFFAFLADYPASILISLPHWQLRFTPIAAAAAITALFALLWIIFIILKLPIALFDTPRLWRKHKQAAAEKALQQGLAAAAGGDLNAAEAAASRIKNSPVISAQPLAAIFSAQMHNLQNSRTKFFAAAEKALQISKDKNAAGDSAETEFAATEFTAEFLWLNTAAVKNNNAARLIMLRQLYRQAASAGKQKEAQNYAVLALRINPALPWANLASIAAKAQRGAWEEALAQHDGFISLWRKSARKRQRKKIRTAARYYKQVLLCGQARALSPHFPQKARDIALQAYKMQPQFIPACCGAAAILFQLGERRKAEAIVRVAWQRLPHPDLAHIYQNGGGSVYDAAQKLQRAQQLAELRADSAIAQKQLAEAAAEAGDLALAQNAAEKALTLQPTRSLCITAAQTALRQGRISDAAALLKQSAEAKADKAWYADGQYCAEWQTLAPESGKIGLCFWQNPPPIQTAAEKNAQSLLQILAETMSNMPAISTRATGEATAANTANIAQNSSAQNSGKEKPVEKRQTPKQETMDNAGSAAAAKNAPFFTEKLAAQSVNSVPFHLNVDNPGILDKETDYKS